MHKYSLTHLGNRELLRNCDAVAARNCGDTAELLAHIAEIDARKLYLEEGSPTMHDYCVERLHLGEDAAWRRIRAASLARQFPAIFVEVAAGRLHLAALRLLAPHLTEGNAGELLTAAVHKSKAEVRQLLAERFPRSEMLTLVQALPGGHAVTDGCQVSGPMAKLPEPVNVRTQSRSLAPEPEGSTDVRSNVAPLAPGGSGSSSRRTRGSKRS